MLVSRAQVSRLSGLSKSTLSSLYRRRDHTGHPPAVHVDPVRGTLYFDEQAMLRWYRRHRSELERGTVDTSLSTASPRAPRGSSDVLLAPGDSPGTG